MARCLARTYPLAVLALQHLGLARYPSLLMPLRTSPVIVRVVIVLALQYLGSPPSCPPAFGPLLWHRQLL
eukprot:5643046-Pyramimonas_sp.AAC.1